MLSAVTLYKHEIDILLLTNTSILLYWSAEAKYRYFSMPLYRISELFATQQKYHNIVILDKITLYRTLIVLLKYHISIWCDISQCDCICNIL